jgi:hypothetical protein
MVVILKALITALVAQGPLGVIIIGLAWWIWRQQKQIDRVQEQRVLDAFRLADTAGACASALDRNTDTFKTFLKE